LLSKQLAKRFRLQQELDSSDERSLRCETRCQRTFRVQLFDIVDRRILGKFQDFFEKATIVGIIAFQHSKIPSLNQTFLFSGFLSNFFKCLL
jgi:hypothetical protein